MIFGSPRQALAYLYAHHRGPTLARPKYHDAPGETGRSHWDGSVVGAMLYGPRETGGCGIVPGSDDDLELRRWATTRDLDATALRSAAVVRVERRLRAALRAHGLMTVRRKLARVRRYTYDDGQTFAREIPCADGQNLARLP